MTYNLTDKKTNLQVRVMTVLISKNTKHKNIIMITIIILGGVLVYLTMNYAKNNIKNDGRTKISLFRISFMLEF